MEFGNFVITFIVCRRAHVLFALFVPLCVQWYLTRIDRIGGMHMACLVEGGNCFPFAGVLVHSRFLHGFVLVNFFIFCVLCFWFVVFVLCPLCPMLPVSLDCPLFFLSKYNYFGNKMKNKKYHTVGTVPKSNRKIPHCRNSSKIK